MGEVPTFALRNVRFPYAGAQKLFYIDYRLFGSLSAALMLWIRLCVEDISVAGSFNAN